MLASQNSTLLQPDSLKETEQVKERILAVGVVMALAAVAGTCKTVEADDVPEIIAGPYLQHVTQTSMTIMWETDQPCTSIIEYGRAERLRKNDPIPLKNRIEESKKKAIHEVVLKNLAPQTNHLYRVSSANAGGSKTESQIYTFQTAVHRETPFAFVVVGDNRTYPERFAKVMARAWAERPNFVVNVGDLVTDGNVKEQWIKEYLEPAAELMRRVPTYVAIGNHERNADWYYKYVSYPQPENYYSFDYGNAHFAMIDSNKNLSAKSKQYDWLKKDLAGSRATWKFVCHHHPPYSSDENDYGDTYRGSSELGDKNVRQLVPLYDQYKVDIVWYGHIHDYERTWPLRAGRVDQKNGVVYIQTGGGGAELENFAPTRSWFTAKVLSNWQYCLVTIAEGTLRMMAYDIDGRMYDYLELKK